MIVTYSSDRAPPQTASAPLPEDIDFDGALEPVLDELFEVSGLEGLAVVETPAVQGEPRVLHSVGFAGPNTVAEGVTLLLANPHAPAHTIAPDGRPMAVSPWMLPPTRFGGVILWRSPDGRGWRRADLGLVASLGVLLRTIVAGAVDQIGIDRLTGVPNRRWFIDEVDRYLDRLELDDRTGTLSVVEVGNLPQINASLGRAAANSILVRLATQLRTMVRPGDLVARIDRDQFAVWQPAMDHLTAAERANALCAMPLFPDLMAGSTVALSVGIASRHPADAEDTRGLLKRAHAAVLDIKQHGSSGWRVSRATLLRP